MLRWPYFRKGVPRSFQPKWKGPYVIKDLIGSTNCTIRSNNGSEKHVHLNQLKLVTPRKVQLVHDTNITTNDTNEQIDLFNDIGVNDDERNDGSEYESTVEYLDDDSDDGDRWCGVDQRNVMNARTRSELLGEGDG